MKLTDAQIAAIRQWAADGETLSGIQKRLKTDYGINQTYLESRLLVSDLGIELDEWKPKPKEEPPPAGPAAANAPSPLDPSAPPAKARVSVTVDKITRPGALVSGRATFTDGKTVGWLVDQYGRLGLDGATPGYRPPSSDLPEFQAALDSELRKLGL